MLQESPVGTCLENGHSLEVTVTGDIQSEGLSVDAETRYWTRIVDCIGTCILPSSFSGKCTANGGDHFRRTAQSTKPFRIKADFRPRKQYQSPLINLLEPSSNYPEKNSRSSSQTKIL